MKKCSRSIARSTTWSKLTAAAVACCVATSRVESWGSGVVWAGEVWENTDVAQQTRESVRSANGERNIFVCFIRNFLLGFEDSTIVHASGSRGEKSLRLLKSFWALRPSSGKVWIGLLKETATSGPLEED